MLLVYNTMINAVRQESELHS
ncbi:hypothetical protein R3I94_019341 [Phoxinus phoxinus]